MPPSSMNDLFTFLTQLMTQHAAMFEALGLHMFRGFAVILIAWYGIKGALSAAGGGHGPLINFDQFASLLITISFGFAMITFYSTPIPGFGVSFYHLIIDQGLDLRQPTQSFPGTGDLGQAQQPLLGYGIAGLTLALNVLEIVRYTVTVLCIFAAQAAVFAGHCLWIYRGINRGLTGPDLHPILHRPPHGMALLGLAQITDPVRFLSRRRERLFVRLWKPAHPPRGLASAAL